MGLFAKISGAWQEVPDAEKVFVKVAGAWSLIGTDLPDYNDASGGTVTQYTRDGKWFRVHTFSDSADFVVNAVSGKPFRTLLVGGGGGGRTTQDDDNPGGGGGVVTEAADVSLTVGTFPVVVGAAGPVAGNGGESSFNGLTAAGGTAGSQYGGGNSGPRTGGAGASEQAGGGAGAGENGYGGADWLAGDGGNGVQSDITGVMTYYGGGGAGTGIKDCNNRMNEGWDANKMVARRPDRRGGTPLAALGGLGGGGSIPNVTGAADGVDGLGGGGAGQGMVSKGQTVGRGGKGAVIVSYEIPAPVFNDATGGTVTDVVDYLGNTGQTWRVHEFTANGDFVLNVAPQPLAAVVGGAGGGGGQDSQGRPGGRGGHGQGIENLALALEAGTYPVVVGSGGGGAGLDGWGQGNGGGGGASSFGGISASGGGGGHGPGDQNHPQDPSVGSPDGPQITSSVSGIPATYGGNGGPPGSRDGGHQEGYPGAPGKVVIAYRIA